MPTSRYLKLTIGSKEIQVSNPEELPISIDYALEDPDAFQKKTSSKALEVKVPATLLNDVGANTYRNPDIKDLTTGNVFRSNQPFALDENGFEIMNGKAFLSSATHRDVPVDYTFDLYGDNADWKVDLDALTLYECLKDISIYFTSDTIRYSWGAFDGSDTSLPYVFAPVRYRSVIGGTSTDNNGNVKYDDNNMASDYMRPSISKYYIIFQAFKSVGYRIVSTFMDTDYFRRQVMPWTWGNFLDSDGTSLNTHRFLAKSVGDFWYKFKNGRTQMFWNLNVSNDSTDGGYDPNNDYTWDNSIGEMKWTYNAPDFHVLQANFRVQISYDISLNGTTSEVLLYVYWYKNGTLITQSLVENAQGDIAFTAAQRNIKEAFFQETVQLGDIISAKIFVSAYSAKFGHANISASVLAFDLEFFRIPLGGTIDFVNFTGFKSYKFLEFFKGVIDEFDMSLNTDSINKIIYIEPTHPYSITNTPTDTLPGYFIDDFIDWNKKEDLSKDWVMSNFRDYNRELTFKYKNDTNDGILKTIQDRNINTLAAGKYVFPQRFTTGVQSIENTFFAPTMHYDVDQWKGLGTGANTGIAPQMVCLVPENISNTSNLESANTFTPKSCYYKGLVTGVGAWQFDGVVYQQYPFMFAVNYKDGGENDPILSYSDEKIKNGSDFVIGKGLLKRFFWQRLAIMRNGQWYNGWFRLKNVDIAKLHREFKSYGGHKWELIQILGYKPLTDESTAVLLRKWTPISVDDFSNTYPSQANVITNNSTDPLDIKYAALKCLTTDIPV